MFIFSNLAISLDGKIATQQKTFLPLGTVEDRRHMQVLRRQCDAVLMGASTLRTFKKPCVTSPAHATSSQPINILVSSQLNEISPKWEFFTCPHVQRILFVGPKTPQAKLKQFSRTSEVVTLSPASPRHPIAKQIVHYLETKKSLSRLLVEGGGGIMWDFVSQNLIDEFHVTLTPKVIGGALSPTLVDGEGFKPSQIVQLKLRQCRILGDELYLIYARTKRK